MSMYEDVAKYKKANPWIIQNLQNSIALCGRFPTKDAAVKEANERYRGGMVGINDAARTVYVSEIPTL